MEEKDTKNPEQDHVETTDKPSAVDITQNNSQNQSTFSFGDVQGIVQAAVEAALNKFQQTNNTQKSNEYQQTLIKHVANAQSNLMSPTGVETMDQKISYVKKVVEDDTLRRRLSSDGKVRYGQSGEDFLKAKIMLLKATGDYTDEQIAEYLL